MGTTRCSSATAGTSSPAATGTIPCTGVAAATSIIWGTGQTRCWRGRGGWPGSTLGRVGDDCIQVGIENDQIDGGGGTNLLQVMGDTNFGIGNSIVSTSTAGAIVYSNIQRLTVTGGPGNNSFDVS